MAVKFPIRPGHPERVCWGCEHFCPAGDMRCGNGTDRTQHPIELWGEDWMSIGHEDAQGQPDEQPQKRRPQAWIHSSSCSLGTIRGPDAPEAEASQPPARFQ